MLNNALYMRYNCTDLFVIFLLHRKALEVAPENERNFMIYHNLGLAATKQYNAQKALRYLGQVSLHALLASSLFSKCGYTRHSVFVQLAKSLGN